MNKKLNSIYCGDILWQLKGQRKFGKQRFLQFRKDNPDMGSKLSYFLLKYNVEIDLTEFRNFSLNFGKGFEKAMPTFVKTRKVFGDDVTYMYLSVEEVLEHRNANRINIPKGITYLTNLKRLNMCKNSIKSIIPDIGNLINLTVINLSSNNITYLPDELSKLKLLEHLDLQSNKLDDNSNINVIGSLTNLKLLNLSTNKITHIPSSFGNITQLEHLILSRNSIAKLPDSLNVSSSLCLTKNSFSEWPLVINSLTRLSILNIGDNMLSNMPGAETLNLTELNVECNHFETFPIELTQISSLEKLFFNYNVLTDLPDEIDNMINLKALIISDNRMSRIVETIGNMKNLQILDASLHNYITELPSEIVNCRTLLSLIISDKVIVSDYIKEHFTGKITIKNPIYDRWGYR
jgi:Leucine-rich repeat (LRR) protein